MDFLKTLALGCALGSLCLSAQAELIDSVRVGGKAYLISGTHLYGYDSSSGAVEYEIALADEAVGLSASDDAIFIAYGDKIEKRNLDGSTAVDPVSGGPLSRNFSNVTDVEVSGTEVFVSFLDGFAIHELNTSDLSPAAGPGTSYFSLEFKMSRIAAYTGGGGVTLYSPWDYDLAVLEWPGTPNSDGKLDVAIYPANLGVEAYLPIPKNIFIVDAATPEIYMDNGSGWSLAGDNAISWISGAEFRFLDQTPAGDFSVVRDKVSACELGEDLNWASDLVHYDSSASFESRTKVAQDDETYEVVHLWGASPDAHLFREISPGVIGAQVFARSEGLPFDDGKLEVSFAVDEPLSDYQLSKGVTDQHVALNDDFTKAYVLHQGDIACSAVIRVYDLVNDEWIDTIPLRWRPEAIAIVGGSNPDSSDDKLAVVYETAFFSYGSSDVLVSYIDLSEANPQEDPATFLTYGVSHHSPSHVQGSRHAVLFQLEVVDQGSKIVAWGPSGAWDVYVDCEGGSESCARPREIDTWRIRAQLGEQPGLILKAGDEFRFLQFSEDASGFDFSAPLESHTMLDPSVRTTQGPLFFSPDQELFTLSLNESTALFRRSTQAYSEGKASDFLPLIMDVATWSETEQGTANRFALYSLAGGNVEGTEAATLQRWVMELGADGHFEFDSAESADLPGKPILIRVIDAAEDDLLLATAYQDQVLFTPVDRIFSDAPDFEPGDGGDDGGDDGGSDGGGDGGSNGGGGNGATSGSGFSSGGGGGGTFHWLFLVLLVLAGRRRLA